MNTFYQIPVTLKIRFTACKAAFPAVVALFLLSLLMIRPVHAQGPVVAIGSATSCTSGTVVTVPITVQNFNNIGAVSLDMLYDSTKLTYAGFTSSAISGNLIVNNPGPAGSPFGRVLISWFSLTAANIGNGLLMNVTFTANGSSALNWNLAVAGQCELADGNGDVIPNATFTNGSVTVGGAAISTQPVSNLALANGASGSLSVVASGATSYQWQVSVAGGAWTNLTNGGGYSGVTTSTLGIVAASAMNGNQYRVQVSGGTCPAVISNVSTLNVSVPIVLATVSTNAVSLVTSTGATTGGNVTADGGAAVTARGVAYGTSQSPTISGTTTSDGTGTGAFTSTLSGLTASTLYYVRAYATNAVGTAYGNEVSFTTSGYPTVTTTSATGITSTGATTGGNVTSDGGASVTARGVAYGTAQNPTTANSTTSNGTGTGVFTSTLSGLTASTLYYVRAYATNAVGTAYGSQVSFTTLAGPQPCPGTPTVTDVDNNTYNTVQIGTQCWTQSNLKVSKYRNGDNIPTGLGDSAWDATTS
ncbi:MAG: hypothetical protein ACKO6M_03695, partial [Bacteroidota bacterium]